MSLAQRPVEYGTHRQVVAVTDAALHWKRAAELYLGLLIEQGAARAADPYGGLDALDADGYQRLVDDERERLVTAEVSPARERELRGLATGGIA